jgi:P27 family predicted phage terminase small subunit
VWDRLAPDLERQGVLTPWDSGLLAFHCRLEVLLVENLRLLEAGPLVKGRRDGLVTNPAWRMFRDGLREYIRTCRELGLTPSARFALRGIDLAADVRDDDPEDTG